MEKLKVLVLGDGLLGSEIVRQTGWDFTSRKTGFNINDLNSINGNPEIILNCIANTNTYSLDKEEHWRVNCIFLKNLIEYCNVKKIKLVHISTDYVYTNSVENASEEDVPVHCNNWYGYTKLLGDGIVQLYSDNFLLIRCTHKPNPFPYEMAWDDQIGNFDYVDVISDLIIKAVNKKLNGVYNLGTESKSIYELAINTKLVMPSSSPLFVPKNTTMNINKLKNKLNENNR
jgi:dTDP-4-dehydrorhamnose reductase